MAQPNDAQLNDGPVGDGAEDLEGLDESQLDGVSAGADDQPERAPAPWWRSDGLRDATQIFK